MITLSENAHFKIEARILEESSSALLVVSGWVNEDVSLSTVIPMLSDIGTSVVAFDLSKVTLINSCGVREWLLFIQRMQTKFQCLFTFLNEAIVEQANMIPNMLGKAGTAVMAFEAPYYCAKCETRQLEVLKPKDINLDQGTFEAPSFSCKKCSGPMTFDAVEDEYFHFLKHAAQKA